MVNEEMYEEEDDDLPSQYRRLTAHLQTSSPVFNSRLSAYLTNNVAMRRALEQSIHDSYAQQFGPQGQQYNPMQNFPSPMLGQQQQQQGQQQGQFLYPPQSPNSFRSAPYPPRAPQQQFQANHGRSNSIATPQESLNNPMSPVIGNDNRRASMPVKVENTNSPVQTRTPSETPSSSSTPQLQQSQSKQIKPEPNRKPSFAPGSFSTFNQSGSAPQRDQSWDTNSNFPFSMAMPGNVQGLLGNTLDPNDPLTAQLMNGSGVLPGTFYDFSNAPSGSTTSFGKQQSHPSFDGLTSTLAPSALDSQTQPEQQDYSSTYFQDAWKAGSGSTDLTPNPDGADNAWSTYFDTDAWDGPSSQPAAK